MAQDVPSPGGLLSKVAKFVRNPTVNWSDLDHVDERESQYSKHQLKEMIERKRANDFVRKREFEQLRKLRQRPSEMGALAPAAPDESGFFDSSQPAAVGQREGTLKKIAEIEAEMAQHQWQRPPPVEVAPAPQFAPTVDADDAGEARVTDFAATDIQPRESSVFAVVQEDMLPGVDLSFGVPVPALGAVSDPGLEEAAIRFANGDDAGCEAALLALVGVGGQVAEPVQQRAWAALFDLYCATQQRGRFDAMAGDYAARYLRPAPPWFAFAPAADAGEVLAWTAPAALDAGQVTALAVELAPHHGGTVRLDWQGLRTIAPEALAPFCDLLGLLASRALRLRCEGVAALELLLRQNTVSGQRAQPQAWWRLRLAWLRLAHRADEFDLVALDYCVTYEVAPPFWEDVLCHLVADAAPAAPGPAVPAAQGRLAGTVAGDADGTLASIGVPQQAGAPVVVDCTELVRIDFAAAGSVLNWAAAQQAAGRQVEFHGLHWLALLFFDVIGVAEHARIRPRGR